MKVKETRLASAKENVEIAKEELGAAQKAALQAKADVSNELIALRDRRPRAEQSVEEARKNAEVASQRADELEKSVKSEEAQTAKDDAQKALDKANSELQQVKDEEAECRSVLKVLDQILGGE